MTGVFVPDMEMPCACIECPFMDKMEEVMIAQGTYRKISRCVFASKYDVDPWRNVSWLAEHKEPWCPLVRVDAVPLEANSIISELQRIADTYRELTEQLAESLSNNGG
jgi:hypothetical protein